MPNNYNPLDFSRYTPDWLEQPKEQDTTDLDTEQAIAAIEQDMGHKLTPAQRRRVVEGMDRGGEFDLQEAVNDPLDFGSYTPEWSMEEPVTPAASKPVLPVAAPATPEEPGYFDQVISNARGQLEQLRDMGSNLFGHAELASAGLTLDRAVSGSQGDEDIERTRERFIQRFGYYPDEASYQARKKAAREEFAQDVIEARKTEATLPKELEAVQERLGGAGGIAARLSRVTGSVAPTLPEQLAPIGGSIAGGLVGSIGGPAGAGAGGLGGAAVGSAPLAGIAYRSSYREAIEQFGANPEEARNYALAMSGIEFGMEVAGGKATSGALKVLGIKELTKEAAQRGLTRVIRTRLARTAGGAAVEAGEEAATELAQEGLRVGLEATDALDTPEAREKLAKYNAEQATNRLDRVLDAGLGGFIVGGGIGAPIAHIATAAEEGAKTDLSTRATLENTDREVTNALIREQERVQQEDAVRQEQEEAQRKADEEEAGFRTIERLALAEKLKQNPNVRVAPVKYVTPEEVQAEREQAQKATVQGAEPVAVGPQGQELRDGQPLAEGGAAPATTPATPATKPATARPTKPDKDLKDKDVDELFDTLSKLTPVNMKAGEGTGPSGRAFPDVVKGIMRSLTKRNTQNTTDVQNLAIQGKLIFAPNAESIGREDTGGVGQFDPETGKMYLYTDRIDPDNPIPGIIQAIAGHESTHAGQRNKREGRSSILSQMMGEEVDNKVKNAIRSAYGKNALATRAVDKAKEESPDTEIENLELVPYFVSEATMAREGFGRLGGAVRDIKAAVRGFVRDKIGVDMDITLDEIEAATQKVTGEIVSTDLKTAEGKPLDMVGGMRGTKFREAAAKNKIYKGRVDDKWRYEFTDHEAEVVASSDSPEDKADRIVRNYKMINYNKPVRLEELLDHKELYENYPDAKDIKVIANSDMEPGHFGTFNKTKNTIEINPALLQSEHPETKKKLRNTILHEVQHWVQAQEGFIGGTNSQAFIPENLRTEKKQAEESYKQIFDNFVLSDALNTLSEIDRTIFTNAGYDLTGADPDQYELAQTAFLQNYAKRSNSVKVQAFGELYENQEKHLAEVNERYAEAEDKAFKIYLRDYGETEARNTEYRSRMLPSQRDQSKPEHTMAGARGKVPVEKTLDTRPFRGKPDSVPESREAFEEWFGDSEIVNEDGSPRVVYHGTMSDFTEFKPARVAELGAGYYFAETPQAAEKWAGGKIKKREDGTFYREGDDGGKIIMPVYLSIQNPASMEDYARVKKELGEKASAKNITSALREEGFDGIWEEGKQIVAFDAEQIKSAIGNKGTFDKKSKNILNMAAPTPFGEPPRPTKKNAKFEVYDTQTGKGVAYAHNRPSANRMADFRDNEYGAVRYGVRDNPHRESTQTLDMASPSKEPVLPLTRKIPVWISGLFASTAGSGATAREIMERAAASPAAERMKAEATIGKYRSGVKALAAKRGVTPEALNEEIMKKLDAIGKKSDKYSTNLRNFEAVANQYGDAGKALIEFRNQVDALSIQLVKDRISQGTPLTPAEQETFETIKANLGRYAHRQYAIHFGKSGKQYADTIWKDYEKRKKKGNGSAKVESNYARVAAAVKRLIDDELMIPDDAELAEKDADSVRRMFEAWSDVTNPDTMTTEQRRQYLADRRDAINQDGNVLQAKAEEIVKDILGLMPDIAERSLTAQYYSGGKINKGILKERIAIPTEVRNLMGEIKDPAMRLFATVAKQTEFIARQKMLLELRNNVEPAHLQPPGSGGKPEAKGMIRLKGDAYGALQNHYVSENLASMLSEYVQQLATFEQAVAIAAARPNALTQLAANKLVRLWGSLAGKAKMIQIIGNPMNYLFNFMGGGRTMLINGNINPKTFFKAFNTAGRIITYAVRPSTANEEVRRVTSAGVTDSAFVGEIRAEEYKELREVINQMQGKTHNQMINIVSDIATMGKETYAMMDVVYKIANFYHQADVVLPAYYEAAGIKKSQQEIDREAADIVNATNVTYKRAAPIVRGLEKLGVSNFGTFFYEVFRTEINNVRQGLNELQRAKNAPNDKAAAIMWQQGSKRIVGQLTAWSLTALAARALAQLTFGDDDDEEKKKRDMLPEYMRNQDFVSLGKDGKDDVLFSVSRIDPAGPMTDIMRSMLNQDGDVDAIAKNIYQLYVAPRIGVQIAEAIAVSAGWTDKRVRTPFVQEMMPTAYSKALEGTSTVMEDRTTKAWTNAAETLLPGIVGGWRASNPVPDVTDPASAGAAMMAYMGGRMYKVNSPAALTSAGFEYSDTLKSNRRQIVDLFNDHPDMDADTLVAYLADMRENEEESYNRLRDVYEGMTALKHKPADIAKTLKQQGIAVSTIGDIKRGQFVFRSISEDSIKKARDKELQKAKPEERAAIRKKWQDALDLLRVSSENLENEED